MKTMFAQILNRNLILATYRWQSKAIRLWPIDAEQLSKV